ncbi:helix-turn-helix domain-containing protein [Salisediminibacterium halotolerans]|uniref:helix-turn-helix domain-containing protein n=1 Tax=Salisediminibacterium halotolerans TaxID=517425 RepID=UPI000EB582C8|nr:helix-turn-helix transcriptional regulator [Salisediminibacterium halotolerans]RLJ74423.1 DNA-binding NarL/FixJ family response regulator [Actinophytocola xinjiangensis]RPE87484.1 DNA-binding NarL/FixJ family response regulator [Salisediminibacterium halotolerans]TWG35259.1 DNA-binding NarL/FixJ family response regulator [Salisediminibacterium halotolerans]GEL06740.1 hypothetical protein SHA02_01560 [Salisediminibacterium halotolerans]
MTTPAIIWQDRSTICPDRIKQKIEDRINTQHSSYSKWYIFLVDELSETVNQEITSLAKNEKENAACLVLFRTKPGEDTLHLLHLPINGLVSLHTAASQTELVIADIAAYGCFIEGNLHYLICNYLDKNHWSKKRIRHLKLDRHKPYSILTHVEHEILQSILEGKSNTDIANKFHFAQSTVSVKINKVLQKINAFDRTEAVRKAIQFGWVHSVR